MGDFFSAVFNIIVIGLFLWLFFKGSNKKKLDYNNYSSKSSDKAFYDSNNNYVGINGTHTMNGKKIK